MLVHSLLSTWCTTSPQWQAIKRTWVTTTGVDFKQDTWASTENHNAEKNCQFWQKSIMLHEMHTTCHMDIWFQASRQKFAAMAVHCHHIHLAFRCSQYQQFSCLCSQYRLLPGHPTNVRFENHDLGLFKTAVTDRQKTTFQYPTGFSNKLPLKYSAKVFTESKLVVYN